LTKKKCIIFDLDGTLVNSAPTVLSIINQIRSLNNQNLLQMTHDIEEIISLGGKDMIANLVSNKNVDKNLNIFRKLYENYDLSSETLFDGVKEALSAIKQQYSLAVLTNKPKKLAYKTMIHHQIEAFFDCVVCREDVNEKKPDPEGLNLILNTLNLIKDDVVYIGDSSVDLCLARSNQIMFFLYNKKIFYNQSNEDFQFFIKEFDDFFDLTKELSLL